MRVLARRSATSREGRYVVVPRRPESSPSVVVNGTTQFTSYVGAGAWHGATHGHGAADERTPTLPTRPEDAVKAVEARMLQDVRRRVIVRRRRVLVVLAALAVGLLLLALSVSTTLWIGQVLSDVLLVGYLVHLRRETARMAARRAKAAVRARRAAERTVAAQAASSARASSPAAHVATPSNAVVIERQEDGSWHPVPVPLPTYVTAPVAPRQTAAAPASPGVAGAAGDQEAWDGVSTEQDLDRRLDDMERRLAVND